MATNNKAYHQRKNLNKHIARRIVELLAEKGETKAEAIGSKIDVSITTIRTVSNALIRAGILYRVKGRTAIYGAEPDARTDAFFCSECSEWNSFDLVNSNGHCRLCKTPLGEKPKALLVPKDIFTTDLSRPSSRPLSNDEKIHFARGKLINQLPMSI